jgi:hypothetical protein
MVMLCRRHETITGKSTHSPITSVRAVAEDYYVTFANGTVLQGIPYRSSHTNRFLAFFGMLMSL